MTVQLGSSAGRFSSLSSLRAWLRAAPAGTVLPCDAVLTALENIDEGARDHRNSDAPADVNTAAAPGWREKIWTVPAETRLGVSEAAEAIRRPRSFIYRRTSAKSSLPKIPHRKLDGGLVFLAGELRAWLGGEEELIVESRASGRPKPRRMRA